MQAVCEDREGSSSGILWRKKKDDKTENVYKSAKDVGRKGKAFSKKKPPRPKKEVKRGNKTKAPFPKKYEDFTLEWYMKNRNPHYKDLVKWDKMRMEKEKKLEAETIANKTKTAEKDRIQEEKKAKEDAKEEKELDAYAKKRLEFFREKISEDKRYWIYTKDGDLKPG